VSERFEIENCDDLVEGDVKVCDVGGKPVMVCRSLGVLRAIEDLCSHADTTLSDGYLSGAIITCPLHGAQFDVRDGSHLGPPAYTGVQCYTVTEDDGKLYVSPVETEKPSDGPPSGFFRTR
jgi:nitrite reductase/ring-hydroxylating ferredoxin subunit